MSRYRSRTGFPSHEARKITVVWCLRQGATFIRNKRRGSARHQNTQKTHQDSPPPLPREHARGVTPDGAGQILG